MELFEVAEQMDEAREKLGGVCELLDCAAACAAYGELSCGIAMLEAAQAEAHEEEGDEDAGDGGTLVI